MNEDTPTPTPDMPLKESSTAWPWGQLFVLFCCLWFCSLGLSKGLAVAGYAAHEWIRSAGYGCLITALVCGMLALFLSWRLRELGERLPHFAQLSLVNTRLFGVGAFLLTASIVYPAVRNARHSAQRVEQQQAADGSIPKLTQTIRSPSGPYVIDIPGHWRESSAIAVGTKGIARTDIASDLSVAMWSEPKEDLAVSDLEEYAAGIIKLLKAECHQMEVVERTSSTVPGQPTIEIVIQAVIEKVRLMFAIRLVEMPRHFVQVRVWAFPSNFRQHEATLRQILRSVRQE